MLQPLTLINSNPVFLFDSPTQYFRELPGIFVHTHEMALMCFTDISNLYMSRIEAHSTRTDVAVVSFDHHRRCCTAIAACYSQFWKNFTEDGLPCPLSVRHSIKRGHKGCLRMVASLCLIKFSKAYIHPEWLVVYTFYHWVKSSHHCTGNQELSPMLEHILFIKTILTYWAFSSGIFAFFLLFDKSWRLLIPLYIFAYTQIAWGRSKKVHKLIDANRNVEKWKRGTTQFYQSVGFKAKFKWIWLRKDRVSGDYWNVLATHNPPKCHVTFILHTCIQINAT